MKIKNIKPVGKYVLIKLHKETGEEVTKGGLVIVKPGEKNVLAFATIEGIGNEVVNASFKIGDKVVFNEFDLKKVDCQEGDFGLLKFESIIAIHE
jgi:co-chaperonin GroES (HSP10)